MTKQRDKQLLMLCGRAASGQDTTNDQADLGAVGVELNGSELKNGSNNNR